MLLKHLYRISLEKPAHWCFFIGIGKETSDMLDGLRIERLNAYIYGFRDAQRALPIEDNEAKAFFDWLIAIGEFPVQGWVRKYLDDEDGNEARAIQKFFGMLHRYALEQRPAWFLAFNSSPQPSQIQGGEEQPIRSDIRLALHIEAARAAP
ncbi:hypothetical protein ACN47A_04555 [Myxococcus fulvus]|uniref:hypothetical protein n=1 Tax=Myxococcus fulvus TaxID=33 RepID=UPI003B9AF690